ncbi:maleylpyruvate isomerase family mycothiol-dependent enzyme [Nakamurella sp. YIM 132087]|uniref:Maleylpyruvate isomerase family mycothiol-dependent enzyme n=1 Tax=Nakamurella alba TaxID=2665158 RepID=A0A7K1FGK8_9ACTN|nr:maleylpyruvate isomerase family mycothiol-dependent enzyme [Nakamurella alba]MTD13251.1 maleylpyruvate isomerase family mycothiol-dependent enzyme [Nakamurella alba]
MTDDVVRAERLALADRLAGLPPEQWSMPSLCGRWTVRQVLGHLVTPFLVSAPAMGRKMLRYRGISAAMDGAARELAARPWDDLVDALRSNAGTRFRPPGLPPTAPLIDIVVHSADIRWGLGDERVDHGDPARILPGLDFLVSPRARLGFVPRGRLAGLRWTVTDAGWSHGSGAPVSGTALAVARGMLGRPDARPLLAGPGVEVLADR